MLYVGMDVSKKTCYVTVKDEKGRTMQTTKFLNTIEELDNFIENLEGRTQFVMEASYTWEHLYDRIEEKGFKVCLANPVKTKAIAETRIKTDKIDSEILADLLRADLVSKVYVPNKEIRELRSIVRHRACLVKIRTQIKNRMHAILAKEGIQQDFSDLFGKSGISFLKGLNLKESHRFAMNNYLGVLETLNGKIVETSEYIKELAENDEQVQLLTTIPGIGIYSAMLIISEIGEIERFANEKKLCSYAGLVPSTHKSGNVEYHGHITKQGSTWIRWVLIQAAHIAVRENNFLQRFYKKIEKRKGGKIAIIATARKMLEVIYFMLKENQPFHADGKRHSELIMV